MKLETKGIDIPEGLRLYHAVHSAMATEFRISILSTCERAARESARSCFRRIDELETLLSRFRHGSDIHVINNTPPGIPARVGPDCWACLVFAYEMWSLTAGLCDVTIGGLVDWYRANPSKSPPMPLVNAVGFSRLHLLPDYHAVIRETEGIVVDLGAIGKGYALDRVAEHLREDWDMESFMLECGGSSALFHVPEALSWQWPLAVESPGAGKVHYGLSRGSMSGSAAELKPAHLINPRTGEALPPRHAAWVYAPTAAMSDALSTAVSLMTLPEITALCRQRDDVGARLLRDGECHVIGAFPTDGEHS